MLHLPFLQKPRMYKQNTDLKGPFTFFLFLGVIKSYTMDLYFRNSLT